MQNEGKEDEGFVSGMKLEDMTKKEESISDIASVATVEFHCAKTNSYEIYIEADYDNGSKIYSDVFTIYISKKGLCVNKDMSRRLAADKMNAHGIIIGILHHLVIIHLKIWSIYQ